MSEYFYVIVFIISYQIIPFALVIPLILECKTHSEQPFLYILISLVCHIDILIGNLFYGMISILFIIAITLYEVSHYMYLQNISDT